MINQNVEQLLVEQIGHELAASNHYLGIAIYFGRQSLDKWAEFFYRQSEEERGHAMRIVKFLVDVDAGTRIPSVPESDNSFENNMAALQWALDNERNVTRQFHAMADTALATKDFTSFQFLQWFIAEQVEEESLMMKLIDIAKSEPNFFRSEELLPVVEEH